jgi:hypothetical protein
MSRPVARLAERVENVGGLFGKAKMLLDELASEWRRPTSGDAVLRSERTRL